MVQGTKKIVSKNIISLKNSLKSAKHTQKVMKIKKKTKKGTPLQLPRGKCRDETMDDRALSKAIDKASEIKVAAKLVQDGGKINSIKDTMIKGKELHKELRRSQVKKKIGRVEEKLKALKEKSEQDGKISIK